MNRFFTLLITLFILNFSSNLNSQNNDHYTIIVSLDGFRWDYPQIHGTPYLDKMAQKGVSAVMRPSYPASTFPNHYTLITGLVPDHNGIINNVFWDRANQRQYSMGDSLTRYNRDYYKGEPIWTTAQRQGVKAASIYWVGSDIDIKNSYPTYYKEWADQPRLTFEQRVDTALAMLNKKEDDRPRLITLYMDEPDASGHHFGPTGQETKLMVNHIDSLIGRLIDGIEKLPFSHKVNLIVTADHGMTYVSKERFININDYLKPSWYERAVGNNPTSIFADKENQDSIFQALSKIDHIKVYRKNKVPKNLKYGTNPNIGDIVVIPACGWQFGFKPSPNIGAHGYDPSYPDMQVIFFAFGPDFKENYKGKTFNNTAIYPLLAHLLGVQPAPNDGRFKQVKSFLNKK